MPVAWNSNGKLVAGVVLRSVFLHLELFKFGLVSGRSRANSVHPVIARLLHVSVLAWGNSLIYNEIKVVEAAGVEPASEKVRNEKPTCVADSIFSSRASESARVTQP